MAELVPYPFVALIRRMFGELERNGAIFDLPAKHFYLGSAGRQMSVDFHGHNASSPLGPAAGPQTQMAQNIVLSWLGGCRVMELKTVQVQDELDIPRPCIDVHTVGLNAEWSQELKLEESLDEYVKGAMLVEMLRAHGGLELASGFGDVVYDMSVGYDLQGVRSDRVMAFMRNMMDARQVVDRLRGEIPSDHAALRDLDYPTRLSDSLTLSTFHGCPPNEIESIIAFLMDELRLHTIIKFNPMLLGAEKTRHLLHDVMGYDDLTVPDSAFTRDTTWPQAVEIVERLEEKARSLGLGFGVKFSNTLIVENNRGFLAPGEKEVYLSGQPLHVLAMHLVRRFRRRFGDRLPISFAAGIDRGNFADCVSLGLVPITVCTDLLRKGGYSRLTHYQEDLERRMGAAGATNIDEFVLTGRGQALAALDRLELPPDHPGHAACREAVANKADLRRAAGDELFERWVSAAKLLNTESYVEQATGDPRYARAENSTPPKKIGSHLELFNCITCDICVPVCPNDANFTYGTDQQEIPIVKLSRSDDGWEWQTEGALDLTERHQIANFADFCNDCGNCDIFCPEDGGPYIMKPRFFGSEGAWRETALDGFYVERSSGGDRILGRFDGDEYEATWADERVTYAGSNFDICFATGDAERTLTGRAKGDVDLTYYSIMDYLRRALLDSKQVNYVNSLSPS